MINQRISLNARKGFVRPAATAVVLVLMAGGANALANTVWHVSKASSNATCSMTATTCNTIGSAVSAASSLDVILVGPGKYNESVYVDTENLTILGAQAGKDPRGLSLLSLLGGLSGGNEAYSARTDPTKESIVDATGQGNGAGFDIESDNVVIDGFTIQGGTAGTNASGIYVDAYTPQIVNNIILNNAVGIYMYSDDYGVVEHNLIKTNNKGTAGSADYDVVGLSGFGIASEDFYPVSITENAFEGNLAAAMYWNTLDDSEISQNTSKNDGAFVVLYSSDSNFIHHNQGQDFGAKGQMPVYGTANADAAIDFLHDGKNQDLRHNILADGKPAGYNGIAFSTIGAPVTFVCQVCTISDNTVTGFAGNGIVAEETTVSDTATLYHSMIFRNLVTNNGNAGILIKYGPDNGYNTLVNNKAVDNHVNDCEDDTTGSGSGTPSTANTWAHNVGNLFLPRGICTPEE